MQNVESESLTDYSIWILSAVMLGSEIFKKHNSNKMYIMYNANFAKNIDIHASAVNSLVVKHYLDFDKEKTQFILSPKGFEIALKRTRTAGFFQEVNISEDPMIEQDSCRYLG